MSVRIGYKASAEQFGPRQLLEFSLDVVESLRGDAERRRSDCFA